MSFRGYEEWNIPDQLGILHNLSLFGVIIILIFFSYKISVKWMSYSTAVKETWLEMVLILGWIEARFYFTRIKSLSKYVFSKSGACGKITNMCTISHFNYECARGNNAASASSSVSRDNWLTSRYWVHSRPEIPIQLCQFLCIITKGE